MLDHDTCLKALKLLNDEARKKNIYLQLAMYGGAAMLLRFEERSMTRDFDITINAGDRNELMLMSLEVGEQLGLEPGWLNSAVSIYTSKSVDDSDFDCLNIGDNLTILIASPQYLLAMKIMAMRMNEADHDIEDINLLINHLGLQSSDEALEVVYKYYPRNRVSSDSIDGIRRIFDKRDKEPEDALPKQ